MRTVMFGLDGATFTILDPLMEAGVMPTLRDVCRRGFRAPLMSTPWPITPQAWTTLATGRSAGHHGFTDFIRLEFGKQGPMLRFNTSIDNRCESIWHYCSRNAQRATVLNYIGLAPPQPLAGHTMPGFVPGRHMKRASYPADLFQRLDQVEGVDVQTLGLDMKMEREGLQEMPPEKWIDWIDHHIHRETVWFQVMKELMTNDPSDLTMIVFDGVDKLQHLAYRFLDPAIAPKHPTTWEAAVTERCHAYFRTVDGFLQETLDLLGDDGRVFIASDHGFCATDEVFYVNKWLHDNGYLVWKNEAEGHDDGRYVVDRLTSHIDHYDWGRTTAFALTPSSNGVYITNVEPEHYEAFRDQLIEGLMQITGPDGGQIVVHTMKREEWFPGPYMHHAPDVTLTLRDHGFFSVLNSDEVSVPRPEPAGTHHPQGVLFGVGPGLKVGEAIDEPLNIIDVAPLLCHSLGLEIPAAYEGEFASRLYSDEYLRTDPPCVEAMSSETEDAVAENDSREPVAVAAGSADGMDDAESEILIERLRSLGYLE